MGTRVYLLIGTKKGGFILEGDERRATWSLRGSFCDSWPIYHMSYDPTTGTIHAGGGDNWYGPAVWTSPDLGRTWTHSSEGITYGDDGPKISKVWHVTAAHGSLFAGVDPAGLFRSDDGGARWSQVTGLRAHPSYPSWAPGNGGLCLHSIVAHPEDPRQMWVGISAVGVFYTNDGGVTWESRNAGLRNTFVPEPLPETGYCVHKVVIAPDHPTHLYMQAHEGVYRTANSGARWQEITAGLPSDFGFPMAVHPRNHETIYTIPLRGNGRVMPEGQAAVWRSVDAGDTWRKLTSGLPEEHAYLGVLRDGMAVDTLPQAGVYFGTTSGELFGSADEGESWASLAARLPSIWSVETAVVEG
jgi:hypothetical protein